MTPSWQQKHDALAEDYREFAYRVSHDLSAPMRAMVEFSKLLMGSPANAFDAEEKEYLSLIIQSGQKMQAMMDGLLEYSRLAGSSVTLGKTDSAATVRECAGALSPLIQDSHAVLEISDLPFVYSDGEALKRIFLILLNNALKFQAKGSTPKIEISAKIEADATIFMIKDNGIGIDPRYHDRIFRIFQKLHRDEDFPGIGMGLTLAEKTAAQLQGRLWVESESGQGATFFLSLPNGDL